MKQRFSSLDIKVIAHELNQTLPSLRVSNIYDLSSRIFLFKFAKPSHKASFIVDSGFRCHLTSFTRTTETAPSAFVSRLRKFLKTRRVTKVAQVGTDRILELQFSDGQYRLFLEFYAGGNIVLCDADLKVINVLRNVSEGAEHEHVRLGSTYNLSQRQNIDGIPELNRDRVRDGLRRWIERQASIDETQTKKKAHKSKGGDVLRKALAGSISEFPPLLIDHALRVTNFDTTLLPEVVVADDDLIDGVLRVLTQAGETVRSIMAPGVIKGHIIGKPKSRPAAEDETQGNDGEEKRQNIMYNDFHPFLPAQFASDPSLVSLEFDGFNHTVDTFFSSIEGQKLESRLAEKEEAARKKLEHAKLDQEKRIGGLQETQALNVRRAEAIEANLNRVEEATAAINSLIGQGMDWVEIDRLIELEQKRQNPVAQMIKLPLKLSENTATLLLGEWDTAADDEEEGYFTGSEPSDDEDQDAKPAKESKSKPQDKRLAVDIDLGLSGWSNAREYYDQKKTAAAKQEKTVAASAKALKSATAKVEADLKKALKQEKTVLRPIRQPFWFEKFIYFISSDGYLVLGGKDAVQSDILHRRHLNKGDVFVHADLSGACPMVIKNRAGTPDAPIPPGTLSQAGNMSVATSSAWDSKAVMSAWWVPAERVTKMAATGDYLPPGKFEVKGDKTFLPPAQLLLGLAVMFQISDESKANHTKHHYRDVSDEDSTSAADKESGAPQQTTVQEADDAQQPAGNDDKLDDDSEGSASDVSSNADDENEHSGDDPDSRAAYSNPLQSQGTAHGQTDNANSAAHQDAAEEEEDDEAEEEGDNIDDAEGSDPEATSVDAPNSTKDANETRSTADAPKLPATSQSKPALPVRGKRGKKKKMAAKYADQDDEDREQAMALLGSRIGQERAAAAAEAREAARDEAEAQRTRRREVMERRIRQGREREEARLQQDGEMHDDVDDEAEQVDLDALVGTPRPGDAILEALPVCAPWASLGRCKYKAKLQPGAQKKGKAVREVLGRWGAAAEAKGVVDQQAADPERPWPRELELVRAWRDADVFGVVPVGKVRVMMGGGASSGGGSSSAKGRGGGGKGGGRGGRGSKKKR